VPPWLEGAFTPTGPAAPEVLAARLGLAVALGFVVAEIYRRTNGRQPVPSFRATLVLLTILIAAVTQVIGDNVARAFSLVGALSIVRFRTVVQDTRDTAFVIFAVTVGMAVGAGDLWVAALALLAVSVAAAALRPRRVRAAPGDYLLTLALGLGSDAQTAAEAVLTRRAAAWETTGAATANRGAAIETTYRLTILPETEVPALVRELNDVEGVQSVQLRPSEA
jgi:hypothetical protein